MLNDAVNGGVSYIVSIIVFRFFLESPGVLLYHKTLLQWVGIKTKDLKTGITWEPLPTFGSMQEMQERN